MLSEDEKFRIEQAINNSANCLGEKLDEMLLDILKEMNLDEKEGSLLWAKEVFFRGQ